ncbi:MAG: hypothetical protein AB8B48_14195 [Pseudomonadales bacterium]
MTVRIAMWSGPRNISTAMMRAWENRADCRVIDEPLYGYYLHKTGLDHPGWADVIEAQGTQWQTAVKRCRAPNDKSEPIFFQKHMVMHMLPEVPLDWLDGYRHYFLIRNPALVLASYSAVRATVTLDDLGFRQSLELYERLQETSGHAPVVVDTESFLKHPGSQLQALCSALKVQFTESMLSWPAGCRETDGVWAPYWYDSVNASTGFAPYTPKTPSLNKAQQQIVDEALPYYDALKRLALT